MNTVKAIAELRAAAEKEIEGMQDCLNRIGGKVHTLNEFEKETIRTAFKAGASYGVKAAMGVRVVES